MQWHLADEYDVVALQDGELQVEDADEGVRKRLEKKAPLAKHLDRAVAMGTFGASGAEGAGRGWSPPLAAGGTKAHWPVHC